MKDKKRFLTTFAGICLAVSLTTSFAGCGSKDDGEVAGSPSQNQGDEEKILLRRKVNLFPLTTRNIQRCRSISMPRRHRLIRC